MLFRSDPENLQFQSLVAIENMQTGDFEKALEAFDGVLAQVPADPITLTSRGHALKTVGRQDDAVDSYHQALLAHPSHGEAWYSLANLKTYRFDGEEVAEMLAQKENPNLGYMDRVYLSFALGKALEDEGDYEQAFRHLEAGNGLKKAQSRYSADRMREDLRSQMRVCTPELMARRHSSGCQAPDPIFILGLPRAGSTLLEQILASHSQVEGTLELPNILTLSQRLRRGLDREGSMSGESLYPHVLNSLDDDTLRSFGEQYIQDTRVQIGRAHV